MVAVSKQLRGESLNNEEQQLLQQFKFVWNELSETSDGLILRGTRLIIPNSLRQTTLNIAHEGHLGMTKSKGLLRSKIWFPGMDQMIEQMIQDCVPCKLNSNRPEREPLQPTEMPDQPWDVLAIDFFGPLPNKNELLVIIDEMSRFPIVEEVKTTAADHTCPVLNKVFSTLGIPSVLKSDNGPPFNGSKF